MTLVDIDHPASSAAGVGMANPSRAAHRRPAPTPRTATTARAPSSRRRWRSGRLRRPHVERGPAPARARSAGSLRRTGWPPPARGGRCPGLEPLSLPSTCGRSRACAMRLGRGQDAEERGLHAVVGKVRMAVPQDWARFGQLMMDDGRGRSVLPRGARPATTPAGTDGEGNGYGATRGGSGTRNPGTAATPRRARGHDRDEGHWGQLVARSRRGGAIVARLGWTVADGDQATAGRGQVQAALPRSDGHVRR